MVHCPRRAVCAACLLGITSGCAHLGSWSPLAPLERSLVFHPQLYPSGNWQPAEIAPEDAWFSAPDGTQLHGWFLPYPSPQAVALYLHGNAGNITNRADVLRTLQRDHALAVMTFDYRGYGRSAGEPSERGILQDARAARAWLAERTGVAEREIVLIGRSLGGAVAVDLAAKDGARGLVLASTFTSLPDVGAHHFPLVPTHLLMSYRLDSLAKIEDYNGPLLQSHGDADRVVPYELGKRLFDTAPGPKQFVTQAGAGHNEPWSREFHNALDEFLSALPKATESSNPTDGFSDSVPAQ